MPSLTRIMPCHCSNNGDHWHENYFEHMVTCDTQMDTTLLHFETHWPTTFTLCKQCSGTKLTSIKDFIVSREGCDIWVLIVSQRPYSSESNNVDGRSGIGEMFTEMWSSLSNCLKGFAWKTFGVCLGYLKVKVYLEYLSDAGPAPVLTRERFLLLSFRIKEVILRRVFLVFELFLVLSWFWTVSVSSLQVQELRMLISLYAPSSVVGTLSPPLMSLPTSRA